MIRCAMQAVTCEDSELWSLQCCCILSARAVWDGASMTLFLEITTNLKITIRGNFYNCFQLFVNCQKNSSLL